MVGRIRELWDRLRSFAESWQELQKLDGLIAMRPGMLAELLAKSPAATDAQAALRKEIAF